MPYPHPSRPDGPTEGSFPTLTYEYSDGEHRVTCSCRKPDGARCSTT